MAVACIILVVIAVLGISASRNVYGNIMDKDTKGRPRNGLLTTNKG